MSIDLASIILDTTKKLKCNFFFVSSGTKRSSQSCATLCEVLGSNCGSVRCTHDGAKNSTLRVRRFHQTTASQLQYRRRKSGHDIFVAVFFSYFFSWRGRWKEPFHSAAVQACELVVPAKEERERIVAEIPTEPVGERDEEYFGWKNCEAVAGEWWKPHFSRRYHYQAKFAGREDEVNDHREEFVSIDTKFLLLVLCVTYGDKLGEAVCWCQGFKDEGP